MFRFEELGCRAGLVATLAAQKPIHLYIIVANRVLPDVFWKTDTACPISFRSTDRESVTNMFAVAAGTALWLDSQLSLVHDVGDRVRYLQGLRPDADVTYCGTVPGL